MVRKRFLVALFLTLLFALLSGCIGPEDRAEVAGSAAETFVSNAPTNPADWAGWLYALMAAGGVGGAEWTRRYIKKRKNGSGSPS